jgi:uncharacterized protein YerC
MTQVSRQFLKPEIFYELYDNFDFLVANLTEKNEIFECFKVLLSKNERTMIAKRIAILLLFARGYSVREISWFIKVSTTTVIRYQKFIYEGCPGYELIVEKMSKTESAGKLYESISSVLSFITDAINVKTDMRARARVMRGEGRTSGKRFRIRPS